MIVKRKKLNLWERLYLPAIIGGFKVTLRHFFKKKVTMQYPEERWVVPEGYRGAPYLVKDQEGRTKCVSCQLCEFVCPPKAIRITPPGPAGAPEAGNVEKAPKEFEINMLRCIFCGYLPGSLPRGGHFPDERLFADRREPRRDDLRQRKTARPWGRPPGQNRQVEEEGAGSAHPGHGAMRQA